MGIFRDTFRTMVYILVAILTLICATPLFVVPILLPEFIFDSTTLRVLLGAFLFIPFWALAIVTMQRGVHYLIDKLLD